MVVTFLLTYRSQLAYQRFWEARSNLQMMTARWTDAATSLFIFDDYPVGGFEGFTLEQKKADESRRARFRGQLLHLMSMLHCFACLHLIRNEQLSENEMPKHLAQDDEEDSVDEMDPYEVIKKRRPAVKQMKSLINRRYCHKCGDEQGRYKLGVIGDLTISEKNALFPPQWRRCTSNEITKLLYANHELRPCGKLFGTKKSQKSDDRQAEITANVEANLFDRVALMHAWILRLIGDRSKANGLAVPPPVLSRAYHLLTEGNHAFMQCKKVRDTPFPVRSTQSPFSYLSLSVDRLIDIDV